MSGTEQFICDTCSYLWRDKYTFWQGYRSPCPVCGEQCKAVCDSQAFADEKEMAGFYEAPLFDYRDKAPEKTEADLEAERDLIREEIVEALGAVGSTSGTDGNGDVDEDADGVESGGDSF